MNNIESEQKRATARSCCGGHQHAQPPKPKPGACCGGHGHRHDHEGDAHGSLKDPVCGMDVNPATAKHHAEHAGQDYHFCSAGCRTKFIGDPERYLVPKAAMPAAVVPEGTLFTCPMHPEIRQNGPGTCPICGMPGGPENPLGARALYLYRDGVDTMYRLHGTSEPESIGEAVSSGCIRLFNHDIIDLHRRTPLQTEVLVLGRQSVQSA
jgi:YHS domain-containing protein